MKIAILAFHFRPEETIGAVRPENWAAWLAKEHNVTVITRPLFGAKSEMLGAYRVIRIGNVVTRFFDWLNDYRKKTRERRASRVSAAQDALDIENVGNKKKSSSKRFFSLNGVLTYRMPCVCDFWLPSAYLALRRVRPELIIATHSPYVNLIAAWLYVLMNRDTKLWVDFRDLWTGNHLMTGWPLFRRIERFIEEALLGMASVVTTVSQGLVDSTTLKKVALRRVVYNAPSQELKQTEWQRSENRAEGKSKLRFCYTGTLAGGRDPGGLFELLKKLEVEKVITPRGVVFEVASQNLGNIKSSIEHHGAQEFVDIKGKVSRVEAFRMQQQADVLVLLEIGNPEVKGVLTGKVFEYLLTDKPILLLGPGPESEIYRLLESHGRVLTLEQVEEKLRKGESFGRYEPVDYSLIAREQVRLLVHEIDVGEVRRG
jgi:hypothetical protein